MSLSPISAPVFDPNIDFNPKDKIGRSKPPLHLIPASAQVHESIAMRLGSERYGAYNWRASKVRASVYVAACLRHVMQWHDGQDVDPESGALHLGHARACLGILIDAIETGNVIDDRPPAGNAAELIKRLTASHNETQRG